MATVRDLMREGVITCPPDASPGDVAALLVEHRVHGVFVLGDDGRPAGVVSDTDLLAGEWLGDDEPGLEVMLGMTARELMTAPVLEIDAGADAEDALRRLAEDGVSRLLVVEDGRPVGVLSISDVVAFAGAAPRGRGTVAQVMSQGIVVCQPLTSLAAAARAMTDRRSRSLVVVDAAGRPVGVITGRDVVRHLAGGGGGATVGDVMSREILSIAPDASLREASALMIEREVHRLVVVDPTPGGAAPLGVISTSDIVAEMGAAGSVWRSAAEDPV